MAQLPVMTGSEFKAIRLKLGLSRAAFGAALGYQGRPQNINSLIGSLERGDKPIRPWIARLATMFATHGVPEAWIPKLSWGESD